MIPEIAGARLLEGPSHLGGGNLLFVVGEGDSARLLKLYRRRRSRWRAPWRNLGHLLEGKRMVGPVRRHATERELLTLWQESGFDVPRVYDAALPAGVDGPGSWLEFCPGPTLFEVAADASCNLDDVAALVRGFGAELSLRQALARQRSDVRFIHEHASLIHVLVFGARLVSFDLEGAFRPRRNLEPLLADELAGVARSIVKARPADAGVLLGALVAGYADDARLAELVATGLRGGPLRRLRRLRGTARRALKGKITKSEALRRLQRQLPCEVPEST